MKIGIFGLGEAGSLFAADLIKHGVAVTGYDPAEVDAPAGVQRVDDPDELAKACDVILAMTAGQDAQFAMEQSLHAISASAVYADLSTNSIETGELGLDIYNMRERLKEKGLLYVESEG